MRIPKFASAAVASTALLFATTGTPAFAACQPGSGGCVLPLPAAPPPPLVTTSPGAPIVPMVEADGGDGLGILPYILGIAALAAIAYFVLVKDDEDNVISP